AMAQLRSDLATQNIEAIVEHCDVTCADSLSALAEKTAATFGDIHLVFANAGISAGESGAMWEYSQKDWQWCLNVNLWGVINTINAFMPRLVAANQEAHFVVTGSGNGALLVYPDQPIYTATKAAVHAITENLHYQVTAAQSPVKVSALFPGPHVVDTGLFNSGRVRPQELKKDVEGNASGISSVDDMKKMAAQWGIELKTTHPDEVAQMAVEGLRKNAFWLLATTPETDQKIRARAQMILSRETPVANMVGA
ncbi:MAG: SDR family NAD(P)-dependent oxidoreductase, partial [Halioglobus sp.]|nr:SDR family NAD(P)-dependent oxidoreductase [Halioglobus sp.]